MAGSKAVLAPKAPSPNIFNGPILKKSLPAPVTLPASTNSFRLSQIREVALLINTDCQPPSALQFPVSFIDYRPRNLAEGTVIIGLAAGHTKAVLTPLTCHLQHVFSTALSGSNCCINRVHGVIKTSVRLSVFYPDMTAAFRLWRFLLSRLTPPAPCC